MIDSIYFIDNFINNHFFDLIFKNAQNTQQYAQKLIMNINEHLIEWKPKIK